MASTEEQKKAILPFLQVCKHLCFHQVTPMKSLVCCNVLPDLRPTLQRADEVNKVDPKVAYYCRMYAIEQVRSLKRDPDFHDTCPRRDLLRDL